MKEFKALLIKKETEILNQSKKIVLEIFRNSLKQHAKTDGNKNAYKYEKFLKQKIKKYVKKVINKKVFEDLHQEMREEFYKEKDVLDIRIRITREVKEHIESFKEEEFKRYDILAEEKRKKQKEEQKHIAERIRWISSQEYEAEALQEELIEIIRQYIEEKKEYIKLHFSTFIAETVFYEDYFCYVEHETIPIIHSIYECEKVEDILILYNDDDRFNKAESSRAWIENFVIKQVIIENETLIREFADRTIIQYHPTDTKEKLQWYLSTLNDLEEKTWEEFANLEEEFGEEDLFSFLSKGARTNDLKKEWDKIRIRYLFNQK